MAASVAAVEGHRDCSSIWNSGLRPINASKRRYASTASSSDDRLRARGKPKEDNGNQSEESLQRVILSPIPLRVKLELNYHAEFNPGSCSTEEQNKQVHNPKARIRKEATAMAKSNNKIAMLTNFVLIVALLVIVSMAESREFGILKGKQSAPSCDKVYGVASGDTCFGVTQMFNLTTAFFDSVNPNLNCTSLFVGQWLCIAGSA
ncbi:hypothetical protein POUND7_002642 [Theobroma cacao]